MDRAGWLSGWRIEKGESDMYRGKLASDKRAYETLLNVCLASDL